MKRLLVSDWNRGIPLTIISNCLLLIYFEYRKDSIENPLVLYRFSFVLREP